MTLAIDVRIENDAWSEMGNAERLCEIAAAKAVDRIGLSRPLAIDILLSDDEELTALNETWRGKSGPTDVLSFPADERERPFLGDIAISYGVAARDAEVAGKSMEAHLTHLIVHGVLHLAGHDHEEADEAEHMENLERGVLAELGYADPYSRIEQS